MKPEFSRHIFEKFSSVKFHENTPIWSRVHAKGQTDRRADMTKLTVAFLNFANAPKNSFKKNITK